MITYNSKVLKPKKKTLDGVEHLVFPAVLAKVGVMNSRLYTAEELGKLVMSWNGVPIPVTHPVVNNIPVSANDPSFEEKINIGKIYNASFEDGKLKAEMWINIEKAKRLGYEDIITRSENGESLEVSTGLYSDLIDNSGTFEGESYTTEVKNIRPDHVAILPNQVGACSLKDGCGTMKVNCECQNDQDSNGLIDNLKTLLKKVGILNNEVSSNDIRNRLHSLLREKYPDNYYDICDIYDSTFVYDVNGKYHQLGYTMDGEVANISGDPVEVIRKTEYIPVVNEIKESEEVFMSFEEKLEATINGAEPEVKSYLGKLVANQKESRKKLVDKVVANSGISEEEANKLSDESLGKLSEIKEVKEEPKEEVTANYAGQGGAGMSQKPQGRILPKIIAE